MPHRFVNCGPCLRTHMQDSVLNRWSKIDMRHGTAFAATVVALVIAAGSVLVVAPTAANAEQRTKARKYENKFEQRYRYARKRNWRERAGSLEARAETDLDPARGFQGLPELGARGTRTEI